MWIKLKERFGGSTLELVGGISKELSSPSHHEELQVASTSGRDEFSSTTTSPTCVKTQGNDMVSGEENCNVDIVPNFDDSSSLSHCNVSSLDLNTSSIENDLHACVDSLCISCINCLHKSHDDMLTMSSCHEQNASISSSLLSNNVEEIEHSMRHETLMNGDSKTSSYSSSGIHMCLMAKGPKVTPTLNPNTSSNDESDDDEQDEDAILKGLFKVRCTLRGDALVKFDFLMDSLNDREESIVEMESQRAQNRLLIRFSKC